MLLSGNLPHSDRTGLSREATMRHMLLPPVWWMPFVAFTETETDPAPSDCEQGHIRLYAKGETAVETLGTGHPAM